jgi:hypothetical protein
MRRQDQGGASRKKLLRRDIPDGLPGETHTSSPNDAANLSEHLIARNRLQAIGANLIVATNRLRRPELLDLVGVSEIKTLNHPLRKECSRGGREPHGFLGKLL